MLGFSCKQISPPSPRTCPKEASGNSTEPGSLGVKQSASRRGDPPRQNSYSDGGGGEQGARAAKCGERSVSHASRPTPVAMAAPPPPRPARLAARTEPRPRTSFGARRAFPRASWFVVKGARSGSRPERTSRPQPGPGVWRAAAPAQPGHASAGATSRDARGRLELRPLRAAPSPGCAGPPRGGVGEPRDLDSGVHISAAPVTREPRAVATPVTQEPASLLRPRPFPGRRGASRSAESQLAVGGVLSPH